MSALATTHHRPGRGWRRLLLAPALALAVTAAGVPAASAAPAGAAPAAAAPAVAAVPAGSTYAALGDSYSAGVGTGRADVAGAPCLRSSLAYPELWEAAHPRDRLVFLACSGARISDVRSGQVPQVPTDAALVTITLGGNDVGFSAVVGVCTYGGSGSCRLAIALAKVVAVTEVPLQLARALWDVQHRAPHAQVVVLGYPRLFETGACTGHAPDARERQAINGGADLLDGVISDTAHLFGARFVDVRDRFAGHGVCAPAGQAWLNPVDAADPTQALHPTTAGQTQGYLAALQQVTG